MSIKRFFIAGFIGIVLLTIILLFSPLKFYVQKYTNRLLSLNPTPVTERVDQKLIEYSWKLNKLDGTTADLEDFKGEVILINFWATWCGPCIKELPSLQQLHSSYNEKVVFLFVAKDKEKNVQNFINKRDYDLPIYFESGLTPKLFYHPTIPSTFIIGKDGVIEMAKTGAYNWNDELVRDLLDNLIAQ
ncbi:MAG: TlpA family protein disulfide reductase [Flavobacteriaceae bacterium]|nr:TlpA family protein disulfide reductase [Muriicola sp.]NNC60966.1 TlpA family protein disulfide reductase [Eudoraea sp.]NNL40427.1 TlpA family protein disulfide reductase [Flavobacteriaceae bacterium]